MPLLTSLLISGIASSIFLKTKDLKSRKKIPHINTRKANENLTAKPKKGKTKKVLSTIETKAKKQQYISLGAMSLFGLNAAFYSPIIFSGGLFLLSINYLHLIKSFRKSYCKKDNFCVLVFDILTISFALLSGLFFIASVLFLTIFSTRRLIAKTEREANTDFSRIFGELSNTAWLLTENVEIEVPLNSIKVDDIIVVHAGEMIPVDGQILFGEGIVDQHLLTGESQPVEKNTTDEVFTSTLLISGTLHIRVEKQGADTITGKIAKTLAHAASFKHQAQSRGDKIVEKGASRTMLACASALPFIGFNHAMALSYSGFGYQMRAAAPLMVLNYLRIASRSGILIKDGRALDKLHTIDTVVFDKTGTLTEETPIINRIIVNGDITEKQLLQYAASAEQRQKHPIALAICEYAHQRSIPLLELVNSDYAIGHGLSADLLDPTQKQSMQSIMIGSKRFVDAAGITVPENIESIHLNAGNKGHSTIYIASGDGKLMGAIVLQPALRPQAQETVETLQQLGMKLCIISGDQEKPTQHLANSLDIDHYYSETLPEDKAKIIKELQANGRRVCFIGDGINDSVALQTADVSISLHGAASIAQDTAEIVLMSPDLLHLPHLIIMSRELHHRMSHSELLNTASGVTCVSAVLLFGMGLTGAMLLYSGGMLISLSNAMLPLLRNRRKSFKKPE